MTIPQRFADKDNKNKACKLVKSFYGLKQAPKKWNEKLLVVLKKNGFVQSANDLFTKSKDNKCIVLLVYVDDIVVTSNCMNEINKYYSITMFYLDLYTLTDKGSSLSMAQGFWWDWATVNTLVHYSCLSLLLIAFISDALHTPYTHAFCDQRRQLSEIERLKALLHSNPYCSPSSLLRLEASTSGSLKKHGDERDNLHAITTPMVTSRVLEEEIASPVELAKAYMGARPSKAALRQDLVLHNNATGFLKSPNTLIAPKIANGFTTPRSRGRSAMYSMARTPYARSPSTFTQKGITSSYGREEALTSSQSAFQHGGKMCFHALCLALKRKSSILDDDIGSGGPLRRTRQKANLALKRRSSVLDDDIGSGGPLRRIRQKANLLMLRDKRELGYTALQQPDHASQKLLLMNESELKIVKGAEKIETQACMALRSLEKVDSPKLLSYPHDNQRFSTMKGYMIAES
ncbi:nuclear pore complex protein NUP1-like protein isoform X2 [Tanacetum coccineum]